MALPVTLLILRQLIVIEDSNLRLRLVCLLGEWTRQHHAMKREGRKGGGGAGATSTMKCSYYVLLVFRTVALSCSAPQLSANQLFICFQQHTVSNFSQSTRCAFYRHDCRLSRGILKDSNTNVLLFTRSIYGRPVFLLAREWSLRIARDLPSSIWNARLLVRAPRPTNPLVLTTERIEGTLQ